MKNKLLLGLLSFAAIATLSINFALSSNSYKVAGKVITSSIETKSELA
ncbi:MULTISPECIES: hypothetical protein [Bacillus]|uniref:Uncharacterized protein n=1 Tax=Bacillus glycinifermentans TaxID=1664069 RepID=A0ABU6H9Y3_9BACI|nr:MULTISPECIES: hypothetical protein [Bacillus]MEC0342015.1 hypothetical protein [Bacillus sonorensis]MEC0457471.1 hypothetical protein [Bacillus sonorensis]MEC0487148.1 hypothetical protein [Bacillus glycinifermentans]MEC0530734.1 hypothetical protein [Bacillus sonorensis]UBF35343.1 hypothetical protein K9N56_23655 [Bacillus sp. PM8313]